MGDYFSRVLSIRQRLNLLKVETQRRGEAIWVFLRLCVY